MKEHTERTFVVIKTDGVQRSLIGEIIRRFERASLKIVAMKMFTPDKDRSIKHYGKDDVWYEKKGQQSIDNLKARGEQPEKPAIEYGKDIIERVVRYFSSGPVVALVIEGPGAVDVVKKIVGGTEPQSTDVGTIRSDFTIDSYRLADARSRSVRNLIHCSDAVDEAQREIALWLDPSDVISYRHINEAMLYDVDIDGYIE